jgi:hypothetical protein
MGERGTKETILRIAAIVMLIGGIAILFGSRWDCPHGTSDFFHSLFLLAWAGSLVAIGFSRRLICEHGLLGQGDFIGWKRIEWYAWEEGGTTLTFGVKRHLPFFATVSWPVSVFQQREADSLPVQQLHMPAQIL